MTGEGPATGTGEFALIDKVFKPLAAETPAALGLTDDAAVLAPAPGRELVLTKDAMVAGVHFLETDAPGDIARKLLRVNLSDLAAMGARPIGYLLATFWPEKLALDWIMEFAEGLRLDQAEFGIGLLGGDTVRTPGPLSLSLTAIGDVPAGGALRRNAAREGDLIVVSGRIGDAALGLLSLTGGLAGLTDAERDYLRGRYHLPVPRLALGAALVGKVRAAIDISDGLIADIGHIAEESKLGALLDWEKVPLSAAARAALDKDAALIEPILTGGDDYELAFTLPPGDAGLLEALAGAGGVPLTVIGEMTAGDGVRVRRPDGTEIPLKARGWQHF